MSFATFFFFFFLSSVGCVMRSCRSIFAMVAGPGTLNQSLPVIHNTQFHTGESDRSGFFCGVIYLLSAWQAFLPDDFNFFFFSSARSCYLSSIFMMPAERRPVSRSGSVGANLWR